MHSGSTGKGPSVAELQKLVREKQKTSFFLITGEKIEGVLRWFDENAFAITLDDGEALTVLRNAVVSYRTGAKDQGAPKPSPQEKPAKTAEVSENRADDLQAQLSALEELEKSKLD